MKKFFGLLWKGWKKFAHVLGIVNTRILLTLTYFIILFLVALFPRLFGRDLLDRRMKPKKSYYHDREQETVTLEMCKRQF